MTSRREKNSNIKKNVCLLTQGHKKMSWNNSTLCLSQLTRWIYTPLCSNTHIQHYQFQYVSHRCCVPVHCILWVCMHILYKTSAHTVCMFTGVECICLWRSFYHISSSEITLTCATDFQLLAIHTHAHTLPDLHNFCLALSLFLCLSCYSLLKWALKGWGLVIICLFLYPWRRPV